MSVSEKLEQLNLNYVENNRGASERDKKYTEMFNANDKKIENLSNTLHSINHKLIEHCASRCKDKREWCIHGKAWKIYDCTSSPISFGFF